MMEGGMIYRRRTDTVTNDIHYSGGFHPSEAHGGGWEGPWRGGMETVTVTDYAFIINCHGNRDSYINEFKIDVSFFLQMK